MKQVSDVLRAAMMDAERQGVSLYRIAKECDLDDSIVYRFYHSECGLALSSVDRLAEFLKLELVKSETSAGPKKKEPKETAAAAKTATLRKAGKHSKKVKKVKSAKKKGVKKTTSKGAVKKKTAKKRVKVVKKKTKKRA